MTRRGCLAVIGVGVALLLMGGAAIEWFGSGGTVPREDWVGQANAVDWIGGAFCGAGLLAIMWGLYNLRNG